MKSKVIIILAAVIIALSAMAACGRDDLSATLDEKEPAESFLEGAANEEDERTEKVSDTSMDESKSINEGMEEMPEFSENPEVMDFVEEVISRCPFSSDYPTDAEINQFVGNCGKSPDYGDILANPTAFRDSACVWNLYVILENKDADGTVYYECVDEDGECYYVLDAVFPEAFEHPEPKDDIACYGNLWGITNYNYSEFPMIVMYYMEKQNEMLGGESMIPANIQHNGAPDEPYSLAGNYMSNTSHAQINIYSSVEDDEVGNAMFSISFDAGEEPQEIEGTIISLGDGLYSLKEYGGSVVFGANYEEDMGIWIELCVDGSHVDSFIMYEEFVS